MFSIGLLAITALVFLFGMDYYAREEHNVAEQYALMTFSLVGALMLTSYTHLLALFLGIEVLSIPLYILAGAKRHSFRSSEASFKYFLLGSFASAFLLMGIALIYGAGGVLRTGQAHCVGERAEQHPRAVGQLLPAGGPHVQSGGRALPLLEPRCVRRCPHGGNVLHGHGGEDGRLRGPLSTGLGDGTACGPGSRAPGHHRCHVVGRQHHRTAPEPVQAADGVQQHCPHGLPARCS